MAAPRAGLELKLRALKLPAFVAHHGEVAARAETGGWRFDQFLDALTDLEMEERTRRRIARVLKASHLPADKTLATLDLARLPPAVKRQLPTLCEGGFIERAENLLAFGLPGRGKTHLLAAIGHELVQRGYRVVFLAAFRLVHQLLAAKRALTLETELRRLDAVDALIVDDIGYIQQDREEMEVLFTLLAERYERRSVLIEVMRNVLGNLPPLPLPWCAASPSRARGEGTWTERRARGRMSSGLAARRGAGRCWPACWAGSTPSGRRCRWRR
jgi:DNA replication protein DnaC